MIILHGISSGFKTIRDGIRFSSLVLALAISAVSSLSKVTNAL